MIRAPDARRSRAGRQRGTSGADQPLRSCPQGTVADTRQGRTGPRTLLGPRARDVATLGPPTAHCALPEPGLPAALTSPGLAFLGPATGSPWGCSASCPSPALPTGLRLSCAPKVTSWGWGWGLGAVTRA